MPMSTILTVFHRGEKRKLERITLKRERLLPLSFFVFKFVRKKGGILCMRRKAVRRSKGWQPSINQDSDYLFISKASSTFSRKERKSIGNKIFAIVQKLRKDKNCNWHVNKFYVVKKAKGFHKGDQVHDLQLVAKLQSEGAKFREILT